MCTRDSSVGRAEDCSRWQAGILRSLVQIRLAGGHWNFCELKVTGFPWSSWESCAVGKYERMSYCRGTIFQLNCRFLSACFCTEVHIITGHYWVIFLIEVILTLVFMICRLHRGRQKSATGTQCSIQLAGDLLHETSCRHNNTWHSLSYTSHGVCPDKLITCRLCMNCQSKQMRAGVNHWWWD